MTSAQANRVTTDASNITFTIPEAGRIAVSADVMLIEKKVETHHVAFSAKPVLVEQGQGVALTDVQYDQADKRYASIDAIAHR